LIGLVLGALLHCAPLVELLPLERAEARAAASEIANRMALDQEAIRSGKTWPIDAQHAWILDLLGRYGWIDAERFGSRATVQVAIMAKHTGDAALLRAILPCVERDLRTPEEAQTYAVLIDGFLLATGRPQRYGSQMDRQDSGWAIAVPLEDPERLDDRRLAIGLEPHWIYALNLADFYERSGK
jgi:hypothetical protein